MGSKILLRGIEVAFGADLAGFEKGLKNVEKSLRRFEREASNAASGAALVFAPIGLAALKVGLDFDKTTSSMRRSISATEAELQSLEKSLKNVFSTDDASLQEVGDTIESLFQSFRTTGPALDSITRTVLDMNDVFGETAPRVSELDALFRGWDLSIKGAEAALNLASTASRTTGTNINDLIGSLTDGRKVFDALGLSFAESTALLSSFADEGLSAAEVLNQLKRGVTNSLAKGQDPAELFKQIITASQDATKAQEVYNKTIEFAGTKVGPLLAKSLIENKLNLEQFTNTLINSEETISGVASSTETFGEKLATLKNTAVASLIPIGEILAEYVTPAIENFTNLIRSWAPDIAAGLYAVEAKFYEFQARLLLKTAQFSSAMNQALVGITGHTSANASAEIDSMLKSASELTDKVLELRNKASEVKGSLLSGLAEPVSEAVDKSELLRKKFSTEIPTAVLETEKALSGINKQIEDFKRAELDKSLGEQLDLAIKNGDASSFEAIKAQLVQSTRDGTLEGLEEAVKGTPAAQELADLHGNALAKEIDQRYKESMIEAHRQSVQQLGSFFENMITGVKFDFEDMFKQVAVGFAAEIAANLTQGISTGLDLSSPQGLGASIAAQFGSLLSAGPGGIFEFFELQSGALAGPMTQAQSSLSGLAGAAGIAAGALAAIGTVAVAIKGFESIKAGDKTGSAISGGILGGLTGAGVAAGLSSIFGGKGDPGLKARSDFVDKLNELIKNAGGVQIFGSDGLIDLDQIDIFGGKDKFDGGKGFEFLQSLAGDTQNTFVALGQALGQQFDLAGGYAEQFGAILAENLLGSVDNARFLVQELGFDFETLKGKVLETAIDGQISWLEFNSTVAGLSNAFEPGLEAVGNLAGALQNLKDSGDHGMKAVKSVRDLAEEALELGATSLEDFKQKLIENGATAEEAQQVLDAAMGRGVTSLEELAGASDELAGSIAGDLEAMGFGYKKLGEDVLTVKSALDQINAVELKTKDLVVNVKVNDPHGALDGEVSSTSTSGSTGASAARRFSYSHAGVSANSEIPLRQRRRLNVGVDVQSVAAGGTTIHVDARGADAGVERRIIAALQAVEDRAVNRSVSTMMDGRRRGRFQ